MEKQEIKMGAKQLSYEFSSFLMWVERNTYLLGGLHHWHNNLYGTQNESVAIGDLADIYTKIILFNK